MRLNFPYPQAGLALAVAAQLVLVAAAVWAFGRFGLDFAPVAVALGAALLLLNVGVVLALRRFAALTEASRRLGLLAEMNVQVNREILLNEDIELIYRTILNYLFSVFSEATTGSVLILGDDGYLRFAASRGFTEAFVGDFHLKLEDCFLYQVTGGAMQQARLISADDFRRIETVFKPGQWEYQSVISAPLYVGERLFGILNLDSPVSGTYNAQDVAIVERFRSQIEVGLLARERYTANIKRYQVDALTGLLTRRYFEDLFKIALERALRHKESLVLALFDVDKLKTINDTLGHLAGDQALLLVANALRGSCRTTDTIGRLGGDEMIACYHRADLTMMEKSIAAIRNKLRERPVRLGAATHLLSFSFGLARFPEDGTEQAQLVAAADRRLYTMKSATA